MIDDKRLTGGTIATQMCTRFTQANLWQVGAGSSRACKQAMGCVHMHQWPGAGFAPFQRPPTSLPLLLCVDACCISWSLPSL